MPDPGAAPALVAAWLAARSISRGLPAPIPDHGGLRVDTGSGTESCRYVFARPAPGLAELGCSLDDPRAVLKLCASPKVMTKALPARWTVEQTGNLMACARPMPSRPVPQDYRLDLRQDRGIVHCLIRAPDHLLAATGYAVEHQGVFVFDRIVTEPAHRRRGLGAAIMTALASRRANPASHFVLVATPDGRALYESLGWRALSPYTTARLR